MRAVGAVPSPEQHQEPLPPEPPTFPDVVPPASALLALPVNGTATLDVAWRNWCVPVVKATSKPVPPRAMLVTLPNGGGGIEVGLTPHWSAKAEYLYFDLGNQSYVLTGANNGLASSLLRFGVNYRF